MTSSMVMERAGMGMPGMGMGTMMQDGIGQHGHDAGQPAGDDGSPQLDLTMTKCKGGMQITCQCDDNMTATMLSEPLHHDGRRDVQLLRDDERHDGLLLQHDDGHVQVRDDR